MLKLKQPVGDWVWVWESQSYISVSSVTLKSTCAVGKRGDGKKLNIAAEFSHSVIQYVFLETLPFARNALGPADMDRNSKNKQNLECVRWRCILCGTVMPIKVAGVLLSWTSREALIRWKLNEGLLFQTEGSAETKGFGLINTFLAEPAWQAWVWARIQFWGWKELWGAKGIRPEREEEGRSERGRVVLKSLLAKGCGVSWCMPKYFNRCILTFLLRLSWRDKGCMQNFDKPPR